MCAKSQNEPCTGILLPPTSGLTKFPRWKEAKRIGTRTSGANSVISAIFALSNDGFGPDQFTTSCAAMVVIFSAESCEFPVAGLDLVQVSEN